MLGPRTNSDHSCHRRVSLHLHSRPAERITSAADGNGVPKSWPALLRPWRLVYILDGHEYIDIGINPFYENCLVASPSSPWRLFSAPASCAPASTLALICECARYYGVLVIIYSIPILPNSVSRTSFRTVFYSTITRKKRAAFKYCFYSM